MIRILVGVVSVLVLVVAGLVGYVNYLCDRVDHLEALLAAPAALAVAEGATLETPAERRARYARLAAAWDDGRAAGEALKRRDATADRAPLTTP